MIIASLYIKYICDKNLFFELMTDLRNTQNIESHYLYCGQPDKSGILISEVVLLFLGVLIPDYIGVLIMRVSSLIRTH